MKYLLTGGGTGGHVYPALAIADEIRRRRPDAEFLYVGRKDKLEAWAVPDRGYPIRFVRARPFPRARSLWPLLGFAFVLAWGVFQSICTLLRFRPEVIIGTGGYVSAPILFAHGLLQKIGLSRARIFLYEPNAHPGLLNQVVGRLAHRIGIAFEQAGRWFDMKRVAVVGYPVRREFIDVDRATARAALGLTNEDKAVLVFGGSGGARVINEALVAALPHLQVREDVRVLHVTGRYRGADYDAVGHTRTAVAALGIEQIDQWYRPFEYLDEIHLAYAAADVVVCRGGAGTLTELGVVGKPALIVPLPTSAEDHQAANAREMEKVGAAQVLYQHARWSQGEVESTLDGGVLAQRLLALLDDPPRLAQMAEAARSMPRQNSLELILDEIDQLAVDGRGNPLNLEFPRRAAGPPSEANALMRWVQTRIREAGGISQVSEADLSYWRYQADRLLVSRAWSEIPLGRRNVGIKLIGVLSYEKQRSLLLHILTDRRRVGRLQRLCGGDYYHGGIVRRNAVEWGLHLLGEADLATRDALEKTLAEDPYFEVRAAAARLLGQLPNPQDTSEVVLFAALDDRCPAVVVEALNALGSVATSGALLERLRPFFQHANWQYRQGVVLALTKALERGVLEPSEVAGVLDQILTSSSHFKPNFALNEALQTLAERAAPQREGTGRDVRVL